jgi:hypothetical protein
MGKKTALGLVAKPVPETLKVQIPKDLLENLNQLDERLAREAPDMRFDRAAVVEDALRIALKQAHQTLDTRPAKVTP